MQNIGTSSTYIYIYVACDQSTLQTPLIDSKLKATFILSTDNKPGTIYFNIGVNAWIVV